MAKTKYRVEFKIYLGGNEEPEKVVHIMKLNEEDKRQEAEDRLMLAYPNARTEITLIKKGGVGDWTDARD